MHHSQNPGQPLPPLHALDISGQTEEQIIDTVMEAAREAVAEDEIPFIVRVKPLTDAMGHGFHIQVIVITSGDVLDLRTHGISSRAEALPLGQKLAIMLCGVTGQLELDDDDAADDDTTGDAS